MSYYETKITLFGQLVDVIVDFEKDGSADLIEVCLGERPLCVDGIFHMDENGTITKIENYICYQAMQNYYQDDIAYEEKVAAIEHANDSREGR